MSTATAEAPTSEPITTDPEPTHGAQPPFDASVSTAAEETAPGPEAAAGAADAGVTLEVTPEPEKVGSRTISYEELERHAEQVRAAERVVANAEANWESLKEETAVAKKEYDRTVDRLRAVIRSNSPDDAPLFNQPATQPEADAPQPEAPTDAEVDAWRSVRLDTLTPKLKPAKLEMLAKAGIETVGDVQDFSAKHGEWWTKEISGFGESGHKQIGDAMEAFWAARQKAAHIVTPENIAAAAANVFPGRDVVVEGKPGNVTLTIGGDVTAAEIEKLDDFTEDAIMQGDIKPVAVIEKHFSLNVARRTSGRYVSDYWIQVGPLDGYRKLADSPTFATHDEAAQDAIAAVRGLLGRVRSTLKGKAEKIAQEIVNALDAADGSAAKRKTA
jgi:hypothetical protein